MRANSSRTVGHPWLWFKDMCKQDMNMLSIARTRLVISIQGDALKGQDFSDINTRGCTERTMLLISTQEGMHWKEPPWNWSMETPSGKLYCCRVRKEECRKQTQSYWQTYSLTVRLGHSHSDSFTLIHTQSITVRLIHSQSDSFTHIQTQLLTVKLSHSQSESQTHSLTFRLSYSLLESVTHSQTHRQTQPLTFRLIVRLSHSQSDK